MNKREDETECRWTGDGNWRSGAQLQCASLLDFDFSPGAEPAAISRLALCFSSPPAVLPMAFLCLLFHDQLDQISAVPCGMECRNDVQRYVTMLLNAQSSKELQNAGDFFVGLIVAFELRRIGDFLSDSFGFVLRNFRYGKAGIWG